MIIMGKRKTLGEFSGEGAVFWRDINRLERIIPWGLGFRKIREIPNGHLNSISYFELKSLKEFFRGRGPRL
jgi:hypothetical protein